MKLQPIVYVSDMDSAVEFYTALGLQLSHNGKKRNVDTFTRFTWSSDGIALHI